MSSADPGKGAPQRRSGSHAAGPHQTSAELTIRQATGSDADAIAVGALMMEGFPGTFEFIFGRRDARTARAIGYGLQGFGALPNVWFAERDQVPVGFVLMRWANRETLMNGLRALWAMTRALGLARTVWVALHIPPLPPHWLHPDEAYVSALAVAPDQRGEGIGTLLLDRAIALAAERGCERLSLRVDADHRFARRMYRHHGFVVVRRRWDWFFHLIRRHFGDVLLTREL